MKKLTLSALFLFVVFISFGQDLLVTEVSSAVTTINRYQSLSLSVKLTNQGIVDVSDKSLVSIEAFLSKDDKVDDSYDYYAGYLSFWGLKANTTTASLKMTPHEVTLEPGTYYLLVKIDYTNTITETDETNNVFIIPGYVVKESDVDLQVESVSYSKSVVAANDQVTASFKIKNNGKNGLEPYHLYTGFYLSHDNVLDAADVFLDFTSSPLGVSNTYDLAIPSTLAGDYYLIAYADIIDGTNRKGHYDEKNETNNTVAKPINITSTSSIDIDIATALPQPTVWYDPVSTVLTLYYTLKNNGTTGVVGYKMSVYLSKDDFWDAGDIVMPTPEKQNSSSDYIPPSGSVSNSLYTSGVGYYPAGLYYVFLKVNENKAIPEINYDNNTAVYSGTVIIQPPAAISLGSVKLQGSDYTDNDTQIGLSVTFFNDSPSPFLNSVNYSIDITDKHGLAVDTKNQFEYISLYPGQTVTRPWSIDFTKPLSPGDYTITLVCSGSNCGLPSNYSLPLTIKPSLFSLSGTIQGEDATPLDKGKLFLYQKNESGIVKFVQKNDPVSSADFNFKVDSKPYTLYFIPDPAAYPEYVPTILGKTVLLNENSFVQLNKDYTTPLVVLKTRPLAVGKKVISGTVGEGASSSARANIAARTAEVSSSGVFSVILLSEAGVPLAVTETDASGHYEFKNLPEGNYKVVVAFELDKPTLKEPIPVDVTVHNAQVNITPDATNNDVDTDTQVLQLPQSITFNSVPSKKFGETAFALAANTDSDLPLTFTSSNPDVAVVTQDNKISVVGVGTTTITALQNGNVDYLAAQPVRQVLNVSPASQNITFASLPSKQFGNAPFAISAVAGSQLPVTFESSDTKVAQITADNKVVIVGAGTATITAYQNGNKNYLSAQPVTQTLTIAKAAQKITFGSLPARVYGSASFTLSASTDAKLPVTFESSDTQVAQITADNKVNLVGAGTAIITAIQNGNKDYQQAQPVQQSLTVTKANQKITFKALPSKVYGAPSFAISASTDSQLPVTFQSSDTNVAQVSGDNQIIIVGGGTTTITAVQKGNANYAAATPVQQKLLVTKAFQSITFGTLPARLLSDQTFELTASATSFLPIVFTSDNVKVATIEGNKVTMLKAGKANIIAEQLGNQNYQPAARVTQTLVVSQVTGIEEESDSKVYPNPTAGLLHIDVEEIEEVIVADAIGKEERVVVTDKSIDLSHYGAGLYFIKVFTKDHRYTIFKVVKQ